MARLLLVDDDRVLLELMARLLRLGGHTVETAASGPAALERWAAETFDALVSDVMMPDMDGYQLTRAVRAAQRPGAPPAGILLLTSGLRGPDAQEALAAGADDFDVKTVNPGRLLAKIDHILGARQSAGGQA